MKMKIKHNSLKILSLAITLMMVLSVASVPAMAAAELPQGAYANNVVDVATTSSDYTLEGFKTAFNAAKYTAFENFENETESNGTTISAESTSTGVANIYGFDMDVQGVGNDAGFQLRLSDSNTGKTLFLFEGEPASGYPFSSGTHAVYRKSTTNSLKFVVGDDNRNVMKVANEQKPEYKITTFAFVLRYISAKKPTKVTVTYNDGGYKNYTCAASSSKNNNLFFALNAPQGKYISSVEIGLGDGESKASFAIDDVAIIFENVNESEPEPEITLSTDRAATDIISSLADVKGTDVYVNVPADIFNSKKVLLALYGEGEELLDVAMVDTSATEDKQTMASIPNGKKLTEVKVFVWDFANGLVPEQAPPIEIYE